MESMEEEIERIKELTEKLNEAARVYYQGKDEIMSNYTYDALYDELVQLENKTGITLAGSPTGRVGYEVLSELPKETHPSPMLSLDKTKDAEALAAWLGGKEGLLSWKMDGLTVVLTYENGELKKAVTRGNGQVGEVITNNAKVFKNLPVRIPCKETVVLRGEAVIPYSEFERINEGLSLEEQYKNPRNLCSGSVRQLNNEITAERNVNFFAFALVSAGEVDFKNSQEQKFVFLKEQGFQVVEYKRVDAGNVAETVKWFAGKVETNDFPSDGLVLLLDDIAYGESLGMTAKFPRNAIAFKWEDETAETTLREIEWSASRTGLINPVAIFDPVQLEGTTVSRASVHNLSIVKQLKLGIGDTIRVYKANMIIPQIAENLTKSGNVEWIKICPVCGKEVSIKKVNDAEVLFCGNPECLAKKIKSISLFVSRDAINIEGMSEATIEKFLERGFLHKLGDLFRLEEHKEEIVAMEGFGEKSYERLIKSIEAAKVTTAPKFLYSLGIPGIGPANAKLICRAFSYHLEQILHATEEELVKIDGIGDVIAHDVEHFFQEQEHQETISDLLSVLEIEEEDTSGQELTLAGMTFVITGTLTHFENRNALKELIEKKGGKVAGSVSKKTAYLINNDNMSNSSKNKKAKELGIPILTEEEFLEKFENKREG